jgi:hypothetical protein
MLFNPAPMRVIFIYDQFQELYSSAKKKLEKLGIETLFYKGIPSNFSLDSIAKLDGQTILFIDDLSEETSSSSTIAKIATNGRHKNLSLWCVWHQLFSKHATSRTITQNVRYFFFLPSLRLESQLRTFGSQLCLKSQLVAAFKQCIECSNTCSDKFRYLLLDVGPNVSSILRLRTNVHNLDVQVCFSDCI